MKKEGKSNLSGRISCQCFLKMPERGLKDSMSQTLYQNVFFIKVYTLWSLRNSMTFSNFSVKCNAEVCFNIRRTRAFLENFLFSLEKKNPPRLLFLTFHYQDTHFMTWNIPQKFMTFQVTMATQTLSTEC